LPQRRPHPTLQSGLLAPIKIILTAYRVKDARIRLPVRTKFFAKPINRRSASSRWAELHLDVGMGRLQWICHIHWISSTCIAFQPRWA
ncbi:MAG TPA: hypothetical protein VGO22_04500, partial [Pseudorhizobium sp.]|nr:hypothetical protein [Pseudorhizobium sp.]